MKTIINYLDDLKEKTGSDYKAAKLLNIERSVISNIRRRQLMADETALKIADALEIERDEVLIAAAIARSHGEVKQSWENISRHLGTAAGVVLACILTNSLGEIREISNVTITEQTIHYAKSLCKRITTAVSGMKHAFSKFNLAWSQNNDDILRSTSYIF